MNLVLFSNELEDPKNPSLIWENKLISPGGPRELLIFFDKIKIQLILWEI